MTRRLFRREAYLAKIRPFLHDTDIIKVITGIRRCGSVNHGTQIGNQLAAAIASLRLKHPGRISGSRRRRPPAHTHRILLPR
ncbi:MAG: hypothetical protein E7Z96_05455 [Actinomycetaceae bacterium]|nr:hypothetical protein [Actinomycetaceae bacterium]